MTDITNTENKMELFAHDIIILLRHFIYSLQPGDQLTIKKDNTNGKEIISFLQSQKICSSLSPLTPSPTSKLEYLMGSSPIMKECQILIEGDTCTIKRLFKN